MPQINFTYWFVQTLAMLLTCLLIPRLKVSSPFSALLAVVTLALINSHVWDDKLFFHIPDSLTQQAALLLLANGAIFWLMVKFLPGIEMEGFLPALVAPIIFTVTTLALSELTKDVDWGTVLSEALKWISAVRDQFQQPAQTAP